MTGRLAVPAPTTTDTHATDWCGLNWTPWRPLDPAADRLGDLPTTPGCYRVRHPELDRLCYVGETGRSLRERVRALARNAHADAMPLRDPHTAAPCLWAIRDHHDVGGSDDADHGPYTSRLELSWVAPDDAADDRQRKGTEAALVAVHRASTGQSPVANFGRMLDGYTQSGYSYDDDPARGGRRPADAAPDPHTAPGADPLDWRVWDADLLDGWLGLDWPPARGLAALDDVPAAPGLYALWARDQRGLTYVGQSSDLSRRLRTHARDRGPMRVAYVALPASTFDAQHRRAEVETELIGAHVLQYGAPPTDQF
jgi:hypothetical protein